MPDSRNGEIKGVVFDKDGTMYSSSPFIPSLAVFLALKASKGRYDEKYDRFMDNFIRFRTRIDGGGAIIGKNYDPLTGEITINGNGHPMNHAICLPFLVYAGQVNGGKDDHNAGVVLYGEFGREKMNANILMRDNSTLCKIMSIEGLKKAIVTNDSCNELLKRLEINDCFHMRFFNATKSRNLDNIAKQIIEGFGCSPREILWVEDDVNVLRRLNHLGFKTALRKAKGFRYLPEIELSRYCDIILPDTLSPLLPVLGLD